MMNHEKAHLEVAMPTRNELRQLRRDVKDALELAIAARAPWETTDLLAAASGLLEALCELPDHVLIPAVLERSRNALKAWRQWDDQSRKPAA
jgi:hypothetical protein